MSDGWHPPSEWARGWALTFILLGFGKVGFCEMFAKERTLQRSGCEVMREGIFKNKNI